MPQGFEYIYVAVTVDQLQLPPDDDDFDIDYTNLDPACLRFWVKELKRARRDLDRYLDRFIRRLESAKAGQP